jgi:hypothetical protein
MARITVRIPDSLHRKLEVQARKEGVSLNQYILFSFLPLPAGEKADATKRVPPGRETGEGKGEDKEKTDATKRVPPGRGLG